MKLMTFDPKKNRQVVAGYLKGDTYTRKVTDKHFHRNFKAYAIQEDIINELCHKNINKILIENKKEKFESNIDDWLIYGILKDYGHGLQRFLPITNMTNIKKERK